MNNDNEPFELCKRVHEATGWETGEWTNDSGDYVNPASDLVEAGIHFPLYTSDYLLEKLPDSGSKGRACLEKLNDGWHASLCSQDEYTPPEYEHDSQGDTPLKALLKLTLKLHEEKLL